MMAVCERYGDEVLEYRPFHVASHQELPFDKIFFIDTSGIQPLG